ncbi:MAG TPA: hypothetical protein VEG60_30070 [Candidatus Binatia bacterium]|nr:hypothetical protein [Candidatus Binatia bacterium]
MSADEIEQCVMDYGCEIVPLPTEGFDLVDVVEVADSIPPQWSVYVPLWTREEGLSDLTLRLTVFEASTEQGFKVELDDIRVN